MNSSQLREKAESEGSVGCSEEAATESENSSRYAGLPSMVGHESAMKLLRAVRSGKSSDEGGNLPHQFCMHWLIVLQRPEPSTLE